MIRVGGGVKRKGGDLAAYVEEVVQDGGDQSAFEKLAELIAVGDHTPAFSRDMRKEGWELVEPGSKRTINSVSNLELVSFLKSGESSINGEEMVRRARKELDANLGQEDAEWLLEHQNEIPAELRKFYLTFPGTVWRGSGGSRRVPCLDWDGDRWCLFFGWLRSDWLSGDRALRPRK